MSNHTKGPWRQDEWGAVITASGSMLVTDGVALGGTSTKETRANARLIAAAPELLSALNLVESVYRQNCVNEGEPSSVLAEMQRVIAKAEGTK